MTTARQRGPDELGVFFNPRCTEGRTRFTEQSAKAHAREASPLVTYAIARRTEGRGRSPERWHIDLWNWQTGRAATVHYEEHLDAAIEYVGISDPARPKYPPRSSRWFEC